MRCSYPALVASAWLAVTVQSSMAVGFGRVVNGTTLGQALDLTVPVSAEPTEQITVDCAAAEVLVGDSPLPAPLLQLRLDPSPDSAVQWLRILSRVRVVEPVLTVTVSVGCAARVSRQFVVFVDPPLTVAQTSVPTVIAPGDQTASVADLKGAPAISGAPTDAGAAQAQSRKSASRSPRRQARPLATARASTETRAARAPLRKPRRVAASPARSRTSASRLQLERGTTLAAAPAMAAITSAPAPAPEVAVAATASAATETASDAERASEVQRAQMTELQQRLEPAPLDTEVSDAAAAKLQARLLAAQAPHYSLPWLLALTVTVAVVLFGLGVLLDRRRLAARPRPSTWSAEPAQTRSAPSTLQSAPFAALGSARNTAQWVDDDPRDALTRTGPLPFRRAAPPAAAAPATTASPSSVVDTPGSESAVASGIGSRAEPAPPALPVTADALIDLEQQAEFFVALGQEAAAVDLLDGYSRGAGGACPLPYLLLLDIHRRRGDRAAHDAVCERYEKRFSRSSPVWDDQPVEATSIADHPEEMRRIEAVWSEPLLAMRLVESLLVHGGTPTQAFDLHCLSELRFLYLLSREHSEAESPSAESAAAESVDLLLPLASLAPSPPAAPAADAAVDLELDFAVPEPSAPSK